MCESYLSLILFSVLCFVKINKIWMCITRNRGLFSKFLSWKVFISLSRLTYSVYLTHVWIVWYYWGSISNSFDWSKFTVLILLTGIVLIGWLTWAIFSLLFEWPLLVFQTYLKHIMINEKNYIKSDLKEMENLGKNIKENRSKA
jgi:peptidoglycan/LPS O-acetylase OafA/YrhL